MSGSVDEREEPDDAARTAARQRAERVRRTELAEARAKLDGLSETQLRVLRSLSEQLVTDLIPDERVDDAAWQLFCDDR